MNNLGIPKSRITRSASWKWLVHGLLQLAAAEKGEALFRAFSGDVVKLLDRVLRWDGKSWEG